MESYIKHCDCLDGLKELADNSIDLICTDPPYGMSFMGKRWDKAVPSVDIWHECIRVLKPGAFAFVMCIPRQDCQAEMIRRLQEAGFNINFTPIYWAYASGFPKASNISKMIDKRAGIKNVIGKSDKGCGNTNESIHKSEGLASCREKEFDITAPATPEAKHFEGWFGGFQPKPAVEIILVCMKPLTEKTYVDQALKNGKGCVNFDACRIPYENEGDRENTKFGTQADIRGGNYNSAKGIHAQNVISDPQGRFPANLLIGDNVLDDNRNHTSGKMNCIAKNDHSKSVCYGRYNPAPAVNQKSEGSFSRFFSLDAWAARLKELPRSAQKTFPFLIVEKAGKDEKNRGCEDLPEKVVCRMGHENDEQDLRTKSYNGKSRNVHPTAKPIKLMSYLITLASRQGDKVLDPFLGSGTTAIAAKALFRKYIGFEREKEYFDIAKARTESDNFLF